MSQALNNLLNLLQLEKLEEGLFRGQSEGLGLRQVFGGQVVGQALHAAKQTVPVERNIHSFHSYFLRPGDSQKAIIYDVETLRHVDSPTRQVWLRANGAMPEDARIHQYLLGYASDLNFLPVALQPHGKGFLEPGMQVATIDHSMWFHRAVNLNQWLLYSVESTSASGARGFVRGEFYTQDGILVASTVQEGVMRQRS